ncbi:MAG: hypothetical protein OQK09_11915 [Colwellia sp.]|nr:hypothetical protein [Colwellia sp.]MCW8864556.1 hypothetical protein [Colwellia sp.]MCW9082208.1 hypothetical protein [Colwellia sp.]
MLTNNQSSASYQSLSQDIIQQVFSEAVTELATRTGLDTQQSASLLQQFSAKEFSDKSDASRSKQSVLAGDEHQFIANLFH